MTSILKTLLYEWRERKLPQAIPRDTQLDTTEQTGANTATVITGFRRVGKTYLLYQAIQKLLETYTREDVVYINFEDERIISPSTDILTDLIPEIQAVYGRKPAYLFLDELQLVPNWSKWVRRILDSESVRLFITGSSSKMSSAELPTELRGRAWEVNVHPLTFSEFLRFKNTSIDSKKAANLKDEHARFSYLFDEYMVYGALPAVVLTPEEKKLELLQSYFQTVVERDISERYRIKNDTALRTLLKLFLNSSYMTISKLYNSLKSLGIAVGKSTIDTYLTYIESSYFMDELSLFHPSVINQLQYPRKVYCIDTGFITALSTKFSKNTGRLFEQLVYHTLMSQHDVVHYYKDERGNEVDFAIRSDETTTALYQVCVDLTDEETRKREIKALVKAGKTLHCTNLCLITLEKPDVGEVPREIRLVTAAEFFLPPQLLHPQQ